MHPDTKKMAVILFASERAKDVVEAFDFSYHACKLVSACYRNELDAHRFLEEANNGARGMVWVNRINAEEKLKVPIDAISIVWAACTLSGFLDEVAGSIEWWMEE